MVITQYGNELHVSEHSATPIVTAGHRFVFTGLENCPIVVSLTLCFVDSTLSSATQAERIAKSVVRDRFPDFEFHGHLQQRL